MYVKSVVLTKWNPQISVVIMLFGAVLDLELDGLVRWRRQLTQTGILQQFLVSQNHLISLMTVSPLLISRCKRKILFLSLGTLWIAVHFRCLFCVSPPPIAESYFHPTFLLPGEGRNSDCNWSWLVFWKFKRVKKSFHRLAETWWTLRLRSRNCTLPPRRAPFLPRCSAVNDSFDISYYKIDKVIRSVSI